MEWPSKLPDFSDDNGPGCGGRIMLYSAAIIFGLGSLIIHYI